jgi:Tol biopolymer transport system component
VPTTFVSISPDGTQLAFAAAGPNEPRSLWLRRFSDLEPRKVAGTEGARSPFWSPDGRSLAFFADGQLKRVDASGGTAVSLAPMSDDARGHGAWSSSGVILLGAADGLAIRSIPAAGGPPTDVLKPDPARQETQVNWPVFLPDGKRFVYLARKDNGAGELRVAHPDGSSRGIVEVVSNAQWVDPDFLVFTRDGVLLAQRFDLSTETLIGDPLPIGEPVDYHYTIGRAIFTASRNGVIAYHSHSELTRLAWFDRSGRELGRLGEPGGYQNIRISPTGTQVLFDRAAPRSGSWDLWTTDLARGVETRVTSDRGPEVTPVWLRDESGVIYGGAEGGAPRLRRRAFATGADEPLLPLAVSQQQANDISPDGRTLLFVERAPNGNFNAFTLPLSGGPPVPFITSPFFEIDFRYSPDGRAVSFIANDTGRFEVYLKGVDTSGQRLTVSGAGGIWARWSRDGRELFYMTFDGKVMAVPVRTTPLLQVGSPKVLFTLAANATWMDFDVALDGQKFLAVVPETNPAALPLTVIANWPALLRR